MPQFYDDYTSQRNNVELMAKNYNYNFDFKKSKL